MKKYFLLFFLIGSLAMTVVMTKTGEPLKTPATPHGILDLEFAYNTAKTNTVINTWASINSVDTIAAAKWNTWLDFVFLFFYAIFLNLASNRLSVSFGGAFGKAGRFIAKGALFAGLLDIIENFGMLLTLSGYGSGPVAFFTSLSSVIKWALALIAVLYVLTGAIGLLRAKLLK